MRIISRLFLASYLRLFTAILLGSLAAIVIVEMLLEFDEIVEGGSLAQIASHFLVRVPSEYLRDMLPVASFVAAFLCIGGPARAHEITALKAGGFPPRRVVLPVVFASLLLSLAAFVVNETLVLANERALAPERSEDRIAFRRGSFWYHRGNTVYNIHDADAASRTLLGVSVFRLGADGRLLQSLHARSVSVEAGTWVLEDAVRRTFDPARPDAPPRVERVFEKVAGLGSARDLALLDARIERLSLFGLREYIAARAAEGRDTVVARGHLHRRLTDPLGVSLFAWLALPLGFAVERTRSLAVSGLVGIAWVSVFYSLRTAGSALADGGVAAGALAPWLLLAGFGGIGGWRLARVPG